MNGVQSGTGHWVLMNSHVFNSWLKNRIMSSWPFPLWTHFIWLPFFALFRTGHVFTVAITKKHARAKAEEDATQFPACCLLLMSTVDVECNVNRWRRLLMATSDVECLCTLVMSTVVVGCCCRLLLSTVNVNWWCWLVMLTVDVNC